MMRHGIQLEATAIELLLSADSLHTENYSQNLHLLTGCLPLLCAVLFAK